MQVKSALMLIEKFGIDISLYVSGGFDSTFKALLRPLRYKNKIYLSGIPTELGYDSLQKYLLITTPDVPLELIDGNSYIIRYGEHQYSIDHCEKVYFGNTPLYYWAIASKEA